jgi:hypothetical protein
MTESWRDRIIRKGELITFKCLATESALRAGSARLGFMILSGHDSVTPQDFDFTSVVKPTACRFSLSRVSHLDDRIMAGQNHKERGTDHLQVLGN